MTSFQLSSTPSVWDLCPSRDCQSTLKRPTHISLFLWSLTGKSCFFIIFQTHHFQHVTAFDVRRKPPPVQCCAGDETVSCCYWFQICDGHTVCWVLDPYNNDQTFSKLFHPNGCSDVSSCVLTKVRWCWKLMNHSVCALNHTPRCGWWSCSHYTLLVGFITTPSNLM